MKYYDFNEWIPCDFKMPEGTDDEIYCLVTCREWDLFDNQWGKKEVRILSYSTILKQWNTKSDIRVEAWMLLPMPFNS